MYPMPILKFYGVDVAKKIIEVNVKIIHQDCEKSLSQNKSLPIDSYLITYRSEDLLKYVLSSLLRRLNYLIIIMIYIKM